MQNIQAAVFAASINRMLSGAGYSFDEALKELQGDKALYERGRQLLKDFRIVRSERYPRGIGPWSDFTEKIGDAPYIKVTAGWVGTTEQVRYCALIAR